MVGRLFILPGLAFRLWGAASGLRLNFSNEARGPQEESQVREVT